MPLWGLLLRDLFSGGFLGILFFAWLLMLSRLTNYGQLGKVETAFVKRLCEGKVEEGRLLAVWGIVTQLVEADTIGVEGVKAVRGIHAEPTHLF